MDLNYTTKTTLEEHKYLCKAEEEILDKGATEKRCPRCGDEIIIEFFRFFLFSQV
ncbi:MAG: hypothetical protein LUI06_04395 [Ruminococcus sp.]|nr:hypothetical protein [Ruminococcus sp.]